MDIENVIMPPRIAELSEQELESVDGGIAFLALAVPFVKGAVFGAGVAGLGISMYTLLNSH